MLKSNLWVLLMVFCLSTLPTVAQEKVIGYVKTAEGEAMVKDASNTVLAQPGTPVHPGDVLKTGQKGSMGITFRDNTIMSIGPDTEITIDDYLYAPGNGNLKLGATMTKGSLQYISGVIAKLKPENVSLKTPTGTIGVRGTHFLVKVEAETEQ